MISRHSLGCIDWLIFVYTSNDVRIQPVMLRHYKGVVSTPFSFIITRKHSLRRLCFYRCVSVHREGSASVHAGIHPLPGKPPLPRRPPAKETPCQGDPLPRRPPAKETPFQGDPLARRPPPPRPTPGGKLRGIRFRPTAKGEIEGGHIQAHTQEGN